MPQDNQQSTSNIGGSNEPKNSDKARTPSPMQVISSVLAAAFGVQSKKNRERDFEHGKPIVFIIAGIAFTILFIITVISIVSMVLKSAG